AAVVIAGAVLALRGTEPAFAVEGDPVMVKRHGAWVETRTVVVDVDVLVREGRSVLRWSDGGTLRPRAGSEFRLVRDAATPASIRVEFASGGGDVQGASFTV